MSLEFIDPYFIALFEQLKRIDGQKDFIASN
jgi:hypothetical protein